MPPASTHAAIEHYLDLLRTGKLPFTAARLAHVDIQVIQRRRRNDPAFGEAESAAIGEYAEVLEQVIIDAALAKDEWVDDGEGKGHWEARMPDGTVAPSKDAVNAAEKWLKARQRYLWSPDKTITHAVTHTVELSSPEDLAQLAARLEARKAQAVEAFTPYSLPAGGEPEEPVDAELEDDDDRD